MRKAYDAAMRVARWRWVLVAMVVVVAGCLPQPPPALPQSFLLNFNGTSKPSFTVQPPPAGQTGQHVVAALRTGDDHPMFRGRAVPVFGVIDCHGSPGCQAACTDLLGRALSRLYRRQWRHRLGARGCRARGRRWLQHALSVRAEWLTATSTLPGRPSTTPCLPAGAAPGYHAAMRLARLVGAILTMVLLVAGCSSESPSDSAAPDLRARGHATLAELVGPWQREPFSIDPSVRAAADRACRTDPEFPPGVELVAVDARGDGRLISVYSGSGGSAECDYAKVDPSGTVTGSLSSSGILGRFHQSRESSRPPAVAPGPTSLELPSSP